MADNRKFPSVLAKRLKTDISATDTTFKLPDILWYTGSDGVDVTLSASDFGTVAYGVWEPNTSRQEFFTWDPTTIGDFATTGIAILARGLPWSADYTTESSARKWGHDGGSKVLLMTNAPAFYNQFTNKDNDETIAGTWTFTSTARPRYNTHPTFVDDEELIDKKYADDLAIAGAPDGSTTVKGIYEEATVAEQGTATATGSTGARLVPANANLVKTSAGAGDENKLAVLSAGGTFDQSLLNSDRTIGAVYSFTAARLLITTDPATGNEGTRKSYVDAGDLAGKFGDGSDGALAITSGTTTLNESTRDYYQYTSVSITDTGALAIGSNHQNKAVYIYVQGDLTVTSSATPAVDARGRGGAGGAGGPDGGVNDGGDSGSTGSAGSIFFLSTTGNAGTGGTTGATNPSTASGGGGGGSLTSDATGGTGGTNSGVGGTLGARSFYSADASTKRHIIGFLGGGGGGGSEPRQSAIAGRGAGGAGGGGGGCVIFVVGGNINITGVFNASGSNGGDGTVGTGSPTRGGGGGGGGGGGFIGIFYAGNVTANTATLTVVGGTGGAGGVGDSGTGGAGGNGGNGASLVRKIIASQL